jgi:hypothetical protein
MILLLGTFPLLAGFFPPTVHTTVTAVDGNRVTLAKPLPVNGMSGIVMHSFGKGLQAITAILTQTAPGQATVRKGDLLQHKGLPTPKSVAVPGDKVIGGYLYNNVLVLAPNAETYSKITRNGDTFRSGESLVVEQVAFADRGSARCSLDQDTGDCLKPFAEIVDNDSAHTIDGKRFGQGRLAAVNCRDPG